MASTVPTPAQPVKPKDPVASIAGQVAKLSTGDRALLRRLYLVEASNSRTFAGDGVVTGLLHRAGVKVQLSDAVLKAFEPSPAPDPAYAAWRLLAHVAAMLSGTGGKEAHAPGGRVGSALFEAGVSSSRMLRLTSTRGAALHDQVRLVARRLAQTGRPVNLWPIYHLIADDPAAAEQARIRIAQEYQAAAAAA